MYLFSAEGKSTQIMAYRLTRVFVVVTWYKIVSCQHPVMVSPTSVQPSPLIEVITEEPGAIIALDLDSDKVGSDIDGMKQLFNDTLSDYDKRIRPRMNQSHVIKVNTTFVPLSVLEFDTSEQKFSILGYFRVEWKDEVVTWNPEHYSDTNYIKVPTREIWKPNLIILMAFDGNGAVGNYETDISKIWSDGSVQWVPEGIYSVVCHVDIKYYPFDEQKCIITYYVSDETIATVMVDHPGDVTIDEYTENSAWRLTSITKSRYLLYNTYYIDIQFKLQRRATFATFTLITPLLMLAFLNICTFLVPVGSGEKGSFAITIFLSYGIFVTIVSDTLPDNSLQISYILLFIIVLLFMSVLSVLYTIVQAKLVASIGSKECTFNCLRTRKRLSIKVKPFDPKEGCAETDKDQKVCPVNLKNEVNTSYTWILFFEKLDVILFVIFFSLILLFTVCFFSLILQRVSESTLSEIKLS